MIDFTQSMQRVYYPFLQSTAAMDASHPAAKERVDTPSQSPSMYAIAKGTGNFFSAYGRSYMRLFNAALVIAQIKLDKEKLFLEQEFFPRTTRIRMHLLRDIEEIARKTGLTNNVALITAPTYMLAVLGLVVMGQVALQGVRELRGDTCTAQPNDFFVSTTVEDRISTFIGKNLYGYDHVEGFRKITVALTLGGLSGAIGLMSYAMDRHNKNWQIKVAREARSLVEELDFRVPALRMFAHVRVSLMDVFMDRISWLFASLKFKKI